MSASPKVAPPEAPATRRKPRAESQPAPEAERAAPPPRRQELVREIKGIALLLFGLFLAGALASVGFAALRSGFNASGSVGFIGKILVEPLVWLVGWPAAVLTPLVPVVHALRLFGRLEAEDDRSWMIFFAGTVFLLPVALGLAISTDAPYWNSIA